MIASNIKPDSSLTPFIPATIALLTMAITSSIFGVNTGLDVMGIIMIAYGLIFGFWSFVKTSNWNFLVSFLYLLVAGLFVIVIEPGMLRSRGGNLSPLAMSLFALTLILLVWMALLFFTKRLKWRGREFMELVSDGVPESDDSFSDRPRPAGRLEGSAASISGFVNYLKSSLICLPFSQSDKIFLVPVKMGREYRYLYRSKVDLSADTWISISETGDLAVHISHEDYLDYRANLSVDKLGESVGDTLQQFYRLYLNREEVRILDELGNTKVGWLS